MQRRIRTMAVMAAAITAATAVTAAPVTAGDRPDTIDLPSGFAPEGVAVGRGGTFYAGSRVDGRIARGDVRRDTEAEVFIGAPSVPAATGLKADVRHGLLWVAGAGTGKAAVYDLRTGAAVTTLTFTTETSFINDVVVTRDAAYFTNSRSPVIYEVPVSPRGDVGEPRTITLSGPAAEDHTAGATNLNGIEATSDGGTLIAVNSLNGMLYTIDPDSGASARIGLGGATVLTGDGILLVGHDLLVLQNGASTGINQISVVRLAPDLGSGAVVDTITSPFFETATTLARAGNTLIAANGQFRQPPPIDVDPEVVVLHR